MKKLQIMLCALAASPLALFAEPYGDSGMLEQISGFTYAALYNVAAGLQSWVTSAIPVVAAIFAAFIGFWLVKMIYRLVKSAGSAR